MQQLGYLADRLSVNVELPSEQSLNLLAPDKGRHSIFRPMKQIAVSGAQSKQELTVYRHAPKFAPAGQSTQMIVGASPETDYHILKLTEGMYQKYSLKRVFYSAYIPVAEDTRLPALDTKPRFCGSTGCIRLTGCCGFTSSRQTKFWMKPTRASTPTSTQMQLGRAALRAFSGRCEPRAL